MTRTAGGSRAHRRRTAAPHARRALKRRGFAPCLDTANRTDTRRHMRGMREAPSRRVSRTPARELCRGRRRRPAARPFPEGHSGWCEPTIPPGSGRSARALPRRVPPGAGRRARRSRRPRAVGHRRLRPRLDDHVRTYRLESDSTSRTLPSAPVRTKSCGVRPPGSRRSTGASATRRSEPARDGGESSDCSGPRTRERASPRARTSAKVQPVTRTS